MSLLCKLFNILSFLFIQLLIIFIFYLFILFIYIYLDEVAFGTEWNKRLRNDVVTNLKV